MMLSTGQLHSAGDQEKDVDNHKRSDESSKKDGTSVGRMKEARTRHCMMRERVPQPLAPPHQATGGIVRLWERVSRASDSSWFREWARGFADAVPRLIREVMVIKPHVL